jgi:hypothetical protein
LNARDEAQALAVGLRLLMRWQFRTSAGQILRAVRAVDTATHPAYQRRGIFSTLTRQAIRELKEDGVDLIFNTPNARSLPGYLKMGWQVVAKWPVYIRVLKPVRMLSRRSKSKSASQQSVVFGEYFTSGIRTWQAFAAREGRNSAELLSSWEQQRGQVAIRTPRDFDYLDWRYGQHPHITYSVFAFEHSGGLAGFAILRPNWRSGRQEIVLTELFLKQADRKLGEFFFKNLMKHLKGDYLVAHFSRHTLDLTLLKQAGFLAIPARGITFTVHPLSLHSDGARDAAFWDLTLGDLEIF